MKYTAGEIHTILNIAEDKHYHAAIIEDVSIDTRTITKSETTLFFAFPGNMYDGHDFVSTAYEKGVRNFVVASGKTIPTYVDANYFHVEDVLSALQLLAAHHRDHFITLKTIAITGSNGKTIIKEWLYQMLFDAFTIVKSPKSFNSQIGMALSILGIEPQHTLGIFEAGISQKNEMNKHFEMLRPTIGLLTNIGSAHDEGFLSRQEKLTEKMLLFKDVKTFVYRKGHALVDDYVNKHFSDKKVFSWGETKDANIEIVKHSIKGTHRHITFMYEGQVSNIILRYTDLASFENCMHCVAVMIVLGLSMGEITQRINRISGLHMRLEMTSGLQQSIIINDAYSADLDSLNVALEFVNQQVSNRPKMAILSAFDQSGKEERQTFQLIVEALVRYAFTELIYISEQPMTLSRPDLAFTYFSSKEQLLQEVDSLDIQHKAILIKGARRYELEDVVDRLSAKGHTTVLQINLNALERNIRVFNAYLKRETGLIAVIKASAYGTGSQEIARILQHNKVAYLAVAFADEGISLRKAGIESRIIVFNPDLTSLPDMLRYDLEPEVYEYGQLSYIVEYAQLHNVQINIHMKFDSGMHRLGFLESDIEKVGAALEGVNNIQVCTIFSHLASSEDAKDDAYTQMQFDTFDRMYDKFTSLLKVFPKRHILNSGGISRFPNKQYDFVRLGIGMYGIDNNSEIQSRLTKVHALYASLIQIKILKTGDSIGYNRKTILDKETIVGIVNIGYADGLFRNLGNGRYSFRILGKSAPILGNVSMDLTIVDLSHIPNAKVGDEVVIFDNSLPIERLAETAGTISYEVLSRISERVKRRFVRD